MWKIDLSKQVDKFTQRERIKDKEITSLVQKFINYAKGFDENIDVKKMKGRWEGYYRIKVGKIRMILRVDFKAQAVFVDKMDFRGDVYKQ